MSVIRLAKVYFQTLRSLGLLLSGLILEFWFIGSVQLFSPVWLFATPWTAKHQTSLFLTSSHSLLRFTSIEAVMPSNHLILSCPLLFLPLISPCTWVFSNESVLHTRWPKDWSFSFSSSPFNEFQDPLGLTGWNSLQSKGLSRLFSSTTVQKHQFFGVQLSLWSNFHSNTWLLKKTTALMRWTFVGG